MEESHVGIRVEKVDSIMLFFEEAVSFVAAQMRP